VSVDGFLWLPVRTDPGPLPADDRVSFVPASSPYPFTITA